MIPYRWEMLGWLWLAFFFNQADRQVFGVVLPQIQADLGLSDFQSGLIASVFTVALAVVVPVAGYVGNVFDRKWVVTASLFGWSLSTLLTGFTSTLWQLFAVRSVATGAGEAFYAPAATALIDESHAETRSLAQSIHQTSVYAGVIVSGFAAGWIADHYSWRAVFWVFGSCGMLLALFLARRLRGSSTVRRTMRQSPLELIRFFAARPTLPLMSAAFAAVVFVNVAYLTWMPTYLHERFGQSLAEAGFASMFYYDAPALVAVMLSAWLSDRLAIKSPRFRLDMEWGGLLLGAPAIWCVGMATTTSGVYVAIGALGFCRGVYAANLWAAIYEVVEPRLHASVTGLVIAFAFLAAASAPAVLGGVRQSLGLAHGISWLSLPYVVGGLSILAAALLFFEADRRKVQDVPQRCTEKRR